MTTTVRANRTFDPEQNEREGKDDRELMDEDKDESNRAGKENREKPKRKYIWTKFRLSKEDFQPAHYVPNLEKSQSLNILI